MDEAAALARRARAVEALRRLSAVAESNDKPAERLSTVAESDDTPAEQECDHFSMRGYVAMMQKKDPKLCSPHIFHNQPQHDEHHDSSLPVSVSKYHRWDCSKCLDRMKVSGRIPTPENVSMEQDGVNDGCSISIVQIRRLFSCTQQSSDQLTHSKTAQECNSKCSTPGNKAVTARNVPVAEGNVPATQDLQASPNNIDVSADILNAASKNVINLPDDVQKISAIEENGTQNPTSPKSCVAPNEDGSNIAQDVPSDDPNESNVCKPVSGHKGKEISGDTSNQVCNKGPRQASLKRNAGSDGNKKRNKSTELPDISDLKISLRKPKKMRRMRRLSELMDTDQQVGVSADAVPVDHANNVDPCEGGIEAGKDHASSRTEAANANPQDLHTQKSSQCLAASSASTEVPNAPPESMQNLLQVHALPIVLDIVECTQEQQTQFHRDEEVTIACTSPMFSHQHIAEVPARSWRDNGENKLLWDSFKTASRNSPTSSYGFQFGNRLQEADSAPIHAYGASSNYAAQQPVIVAVDPYTKEAVSLVQPRCVPSTALTMGSGQSGLYPKEPMPATHLLRLMDSSTAPGFRNYQGADKRQMELHQTQILGSKFVQHDQYNASPSTSYGSHVIEEAPLTLHDLSRRQLQQNLHRPIRPHPRVGVLGSLLQQDIANWSENYGPQSGYRLGVSQGTTSLDMNRKGNYKNISGGWNALQLGSATSVANPEYQLPRYGTGQPSTCSYGKTVHPLDKLVRKDICVTNRNPADFTVISDKNEYMRTI